MLTTTHSTNLLANACWFVSCICWTVALGHPIGQHFVVQPSMQLYHLPFRLFCRTVLRPNLLCVVSWTVALGHPIGQHFVVQAPMQTRTPFHFFLMVLLAVSNGIHRCTNLPFRLFCTTVLWPKLFLSSSPLAIVFVSFYPSTRHF